MAAAIVYAFASMFGVHHRAHHHHRQTAGAGAI
jgi:hypothetical protein